jgi:tetratricopeptide (TPR) repeat protein
VLDTKRRFPRQHQSSRRLSTSIQPRIEAAQLNAETYFKRKKYSEAIVAYKQLQKIKNPPSTADLFALGRSYFYNLQFVEADSAFTKVAAKHLT